MTIRETSTMNVMYQINERCMNNVDEKLVATGKIA